MFILVFFFFVLFVKPTGMGCLGHIVIVEDPDFDKWGIEVQVSFRDNEPLVRLDTHRQSGGVRATMVFS